MLPWAGTLDPLELAAVLGAVGELGELLALELDVGNDVDELGVDSLVVGGDQGTLGVGERDDGSAELDDLEGGVLGNVTGTGDGDALAGEGLLSARGVLDHVLDVLCVGNQSVICPLIKYESRGKTHVDETVTGGLRADQRTTPAATLTGKDTLPLVLLGAVGTEEVTNLTATDTNVTSGNVSVGTNVLVKLAHESNAEPADLVVGLALGVEVGTTLSTAHVKAGEGILEDLLETQELEDGKVDSGVETETALVGTEGRVVLNTETTVDLDLALVVLPDNAELDDALGDSGDLECALVLGVLLEERGVLEGGCKLCRNNISSCPPTYHLVASLKLSQPLQV